MGRAFDVIELFSRIKHGNMFCAMHYLPYSTADIAMKLLQGPHIQQYIMNVKLWNLKIKLGNVKDLKTFIVVGMCGVSQIISLNIYCYSLILSMRVCFAFESGTHFSIISL